MRPLLVLTAIGLTLAGGAAPATTPIVVAVVDSGVDPSVPGLIAGRNVFDNSVDTHDDQGHGTGVARVVAAGCNGCRIMPVKIDANGTSTQGTIAAGIRWASEHGARVINLSWGLALGAQSTREVERAIANATRRGALVTTGAMNDGTRNPRINPWASDSPDAVRVTAVDDQGHLLPASNHGVWVDVGAPGTASSNAAPRAAAAAAEVLAAHPRLTPLQVRAALRRGCRALPLLDVGWHCVLDPEGAVKAANANVATYRLVRGQSRPRRRHRDRRGDRVRPVLRRPAGRRHARDPQGRASAGKPLPPLARRLPRDSAGLRAAHRRADEDDRLLRPVSSSRCRVWSFWAEARLVSTSAPR